MSKTPEEIQNEFQELDLFNMKQSIIRSNIDTLLNCKRQTQSNDISGIIETKLKECIDSIEVP